MPKVVIQAGHQNIQYNIDPGLRSGTGAPGEQNFTLDIANQVSAGLRLRGFEVVQTDANANSDPIVIDNDYDFFLALHYDADVYGKGGGFWGYPDPSADLSNDKSRALGEVMATTYFNTTGVVQYQQRQNPNTLFYYMWKALSANTPCGLLECGVGQHKPDDYDLLQNNRTKVIEGIVRGFCVAFGMLYEIPTPPENITPPSPTQPEVPATPTVPASPITFQELIDQIIQLIKHWWKH